MDSLYRRWAEIRKPSKSDYSGVDSDGYYFVDDQEFARPVFVSHPRRLGYYKEGIPTRLANLAREYCIEDLVFEPSAQVVDVGAHSGEFGLWLEQFEVSYLGIEPDPVAHGALARNLPNSPLEPVALGAKAGQARFSLATSTGDSSLEVGAGKSITVQVKTLDEVAALAFPEGTIAVLKIEAEGFEPEVLQGGAKTLARTELVTVDAGEERSGQSTAPACINYLLGSGFKLRRVFLRRGIFLFSSELFTGSLEQPGGPESLPHYT